MVRHTMQKYFTGVLLAVLLVSLPVLSHAATIPVVDRPTAERAVAAITGQERVSEYCKPCGDTERKLIDVLSVTHKYVPGGIHVFVNEKAVNIANIYIKRDRVWHNLAWLVGQDPGYSPRIMEWKEEPEVKK